MMIIVNRHGDVITGSVNGQQFSVAFDQEKYNSMISLQQRAEKIENMDQMHAVVKEFEILTQEDYSAKVETVSPYIVGNKHTNKFYLRYGNVISSEALPQVFVDKILKSVDKGIDVTPLIKCWARFMRPVKGRPPYTAERAELFARYIDADYTNEETVAKLMAEHGLSADVAKQKATTKQVSITMEGLLVCYKVSTEIEDKYLLNEKEEVEKRARHGVEVDEYTGVKTYKKAAVSEDRVFEPKVMGNRGDAFYSGDKLGHIIRVGHVHYLDSWDKVGRPGQKGLHCGGLNYIKGYQQPGTVTHNIFVDPMDIHTIASVHGIGNDGAMTVRRYFVHSAMDSVNRSIYHSSTYAQLTDKEYAEIVQQAVDASKMEHEKVEQLLKEKQALSVASASSSGGQEALAAGEVFGQ